METKTTITFDQLPQMVSDLTEEVLQIKELLLSSSDETPGKSKFPDYSHVICDIGRAMEITQKAKSTIYSLVRKGQMPGMKQGKKLYFFEDEIARWIEQGRKSANSESSEVTLRQLRSTVRHKPKSLLNY